MVKNGRAQPEETTWDSHSWGVQRGWVKCALGGSRRQGPWRSRGVECHLSDGLIWCAKLRLDTVGLTSQRAGGFGTSLLQTGWSLFHCGVSDSETREAGGGDSCCPPAQCLYAGACPGEPERCLPPPLGGGRDRDCCWCL